MSGIGALIVSLEANIAQYASSMDKAAAIAEQRMKQIDKAVGIVKTSLAAFGAGLTVGITLDAIKNKIEGAIQAAAGLQELAERTGTTAERLSGLAAVAKLSGTDTDSLATSLQKLSKASVDAQDGGNKTTAAFNALKINVKDLKGLKPDEVFALIAKQQSKLADGTEKNAIMQALLGKAGANQLPVMKDLVTVGELQVKVTAEQAALALEYEKNLIRVEAAQKAVYKVIAFDMLPVLNAFEEALLDWIKNSDGVKKSVDELAANHSILEFAKEGANALGVLIDGLDGVARVAMIASASVSGMGRVWAAFRAGGKDNAELGAQIQKETFEKIDRILQKPLFSDVLGKRISAMDQSVYARGKGFKDPRILGETPADETVGYRPTPNYHPNTGGGADDPAKLAMEGQIKLGEEMVKAVQKQYEASEGFVKEFYSLQMISAEDYFATERQLIEDELAGKMAAYALEEAEIKKYAATHTKQTEQQDAANKLSKVTEERLAAVTEATVKKTKVDFEQIKAIKQNELAEKALVYQWGLDNIALQFSIDLMGKSTLEAQKLTASRQIDLQVQQQRHNLEQQGYKGQELETMMAKAMADAEQQKLTVADLVTAAYEKQRDALFGAGEALRKYGEDATNVGAHVESVITDSLKGLEDMLVSFFTTGKLSWQSLEQTILSGITRIIVQEQLIKPLTDYLSGGMSSGSGAGGLMGGFLKTLGIGGGSGANAPGGSNFGMDLGFGDPFALASGGPVSAGSTYMVGEEGPELFSPTSSGRIIPNDQLGSGGSGASQVNHITINVPNTTSRDTAGQIAVAVRRAIAQAPRHS